MHRVIKSVSVVSSRSFKNFGHKKEPISTFTTLWHGFLTFTFIGLAVDWDMVSTFIFGTEPGSNPALWNKEKPPVEPSGEGGRS